MLCLDTYPLVEIHKGNPRFTVLLDEEIVITELTMAEFYSILYRRYNEKTAEYWYRKLLPVLVPVSSRTLMATMRFKAETSREDLSFFDCAGYIYALENGMQFVTGDKAFKGRKGVRFIG